MGISVVLDIAIGLVFVFFVFSLVASGVHETFTRLLATRSKQLWRSLGTLLDGDHAQQRKDRAMEVVGGLNGGRDPRPDRTASPTTAKQKLFAHELIRGLDEAAVRGKTKLAHIEPDLFTKALLDVVSGNQDLADTAAFRKALGQLPQGAIADELKEQLEAIARHAGDQIDDLRDDISEWFDTRMDGLSKAYRRRTKWWVFAIGVAVAIGFNVDAVHVANEFYENEAVRALVVSEAEGLAETCTFEDGKPDDACEAEIENVSEALDLPVWWSGDRDVGFTTFIGWLVAAAAIAQGAPFWFDIMRRLTGIKRSARTT